VAHLLGSKVLLVTGGGIGRPIDEISLNRALFDKEGVEIVGVVLNKVLIDKIDYVRDFARRGLERLGIELLGVVPAEPLLADPNLQQVSEAVRGEFLNGRKSWRRRVRRTIIGAMSSSNVISHFTPGTLVVTPGDREDVILAALSITSLEDTHRHQLAGLVLSGDLKPHPAVADLIQRSALPVIACPLDSYTVASRIHSMTVKTLPGDTEKIEKIQALVDRHVEVDRMLAKLGM